MGRLLKKNLNDMWRIKYIFYSLDLAGETKWEVKELAWLELEVQGLEDGDDFKLSLSRFSEAALSSTSFEDSENTFICQS